MREWKVERIATFSDDELASFIQKIDSQPNQEVKEVIFIGNNTVDVRIYQIVYTKE